MIYFLVSFPAIMHLFSTWVYRLLKNPDSLSSFGESTLKSVGMGYRDVVTVSSSSPAIRAFELMEKHQISAVGVVKDGRLVGSVSDSDVRQVVPKKGFKMYGITVDDLLKQIHKDEPYKIVAVEDTATLRDVFMLLCQKQIHRVYLVQDKDQMKPSGVVTFKELLSHLLSLVKRLDIH
eukprot:m.48205 g.48205  ORF g.48205 m.48205 type:complete len:178 (+) comp11020_c0_seq3:1302-1835(+)